MTQYIDINYFCTYSMSNIIKNGKYFIHDKIYTIIKANKTIDNCFAMINDGKEITIIMEQWSKNSNLLAKDIIVSDRDWKIITFAMDLNFELVGFISTISKALADVGISIFVMSGYSTDHLMIKKDKLNRTIEVLHQLGFDRI